MENKLPKHNGTNKPLKVSFDIDNEKVHQSIDKLESDIISDEPISYRILDTSEIISKVDETVNEFIERYGLTKYTIFEILYITTSYMSAECRKNWDKFELEIHEGSNSYEEYETQITQMYNSIKDEMDVFVNMSSDQIIENLSSIDNEKPIDKNLLSKEYVDSYKSHLILQINKILEYCDDHIKKSL